MKKMKFICIVSLLIALAALFSACNLKNDADDGTSVSSNLSDEETETEVPTVPVEIVKDYKSEYTVIYGASASGDVKDCATLLSNKLRSVAGAAVSVKTDDAEAADKEILVGVTDRDVGTSEETLTKNDWSVSVAGEKVVILGGSDEALRYAVTYFIYQYVKDGSVSVDRALNYVHKSESTTMRFTKDTDKIKVYGRSSVTTSGITVDCSDGGIEFNAECCGDISVTLSSTNNTYFTAYVNGERVDKQFLATSGSNTFKVAEGLDYGVYNVRLLKCANVAQANCVAESVKLDGKLLDAPKDKELLIEFIGDSIVCGYGVIDGAKNDKDYVGTYKYCDATSAFGYLTAEKLGADWRIEGFSGMGIVKGWGANTVPEVYYTHTWTRNKTTQYDFASDRVPDVVVINLGTNDQSFASDMTADQFKTAVKTFVTTIRAKYGENMPIVWAYGMMNDTMNSYVKSALESLGGENSGYYMIKLTKNTNGGNGHPDAAGQRTAAEELTKYLKENVLK